MLVAVCDQFFGTSTSFWRKIVVPFSLPIRAVRFSHSTASNGEIFPSVKKRSKINPLCVPVFPGVPASTDLPCSAGFTVAILFLQAPGPHWLPWGNPLILLLCVCRGHARSSSVALARFVAPWKPRRESQKFAARILRRQVWRPQTKTTCHRLFGLSEPTWQACHFARTKRGAVTSRWILLRKTRVSFVVRPDLINFDWVRLALPRPPESGVAVSTAGKILSREKRKMWMRFSQSAHILWCVFCRRTISRTLT